MNIAHAIKLGQIEIGIGAGVENMSLFAMEGVVDPACLSPAIYENVGAQNCLMPMGITSENVAEKYGITREEQDIFAYES